MKEKGVVLGWEGIGEGEGMGKEGDQKETTKTSWFENSIMNPNSL